MNEVFLIGRIHEIPSSKKEVQFILEVKRSYKNEKGEFASDYLPCRIWKGAMDAIISSCKEGDVIAIKGRLENDDNQIIIIVEKMKFIYKDNKFQRE